MKKIVTQPEQRAFFEDVANGRSADDRNGSSFSDPSFAVNKRAPVHRWVPWIAGFSKDFVSDAICRHLQKPGVILDPFAGVGTTLVEAVLRGHDAVGFEINPYAVLATRAKTSAYLVSLSHFKTAVKKFELFYLRALKTGYEPESKPPVGFHTRAEFYSPKVLHKVLVVQDFVQGKVSGITKDLFALAFAATMVSYSNYSYEPSLSRRASAGKTDILDFDVGKTVLRKLSEMAEDIRWLSQNMNQRVPRAEIWNDSFFNCRQFMTGGTVDLVVTSPPYLNNYHYNRNTRPQLYWLNFAQSSKDFVPLEQQNFGKYWQTVRGGKRIDLDFPEPDAGIVRCLDLIREQKPEKGVYGGNGWANYAASYFNDCYRFAKVVKWTLRRRGTALVVIGNNIIQGVMVPTDRFLARIADAAGLEVIDIHIPRETRVGNSIIQSKVRVTKAKKSHRLYEAVVELRKR
ncbi:MAG: site-specific DNA-methyltransferase [candidate division Zixibacteria bacterium]|nr:site-specific DNA-methyltransferase [candidate division Zixibacteria bacterium]